LLILNNYQLHFKFIIFILIAATQLGCQSYSTVEFDNKGGVTVKNPTAIFEDVEILEWKVGPLKRQRVSKGFRLGISFPLIKSDELIKIVDLRDVDSWIVRVNRGSNFGHVNLGSLYVPLKKPGKKAELGLRPMIKGYVQVYYGAAALSKRFETSTCPGFHHRKVIEEANIRDTPNTSSSLIVLNDAQETASSERVHAFGYNPYPFNGGMDLKGNYFLEIAFYNSQKKIIKSSFIPYADFLEVGYEKEIAIKGCGASEMPNNIPAEREKNGVRQFKFGK
jgi:hypothetical protein